MQAIDMCARLSCCRNADRAALSHLVDECSTSVGFTGVTDNVKELVSVTMAEAVRRYHLANGFPMQ